MQLFRIAGDRKRLGGDLGDGSGVSIATVFSAPVLMSSISRFKPSRSIASCRQSLIVSLTSG